MKRLLISSVVLGSLALSGGNALAQGAPTRNIDTFDELQSGNVVLEVDSTFVPGPIFSNEVGLNESLTIGGTRDVSLVFTGTGDFVFATAEIPSGSGVFSLSNESGYNSDTILTWGNVSESLAIYKEFVFDLTLADQNIDLTLTVDNGATTTSVTKNIPNGFPTPAELIIGFQEFDNPLVLTSDTSIISSIELTITGDEDHDLSFTGISVRGTEPTIPESAPISGKTILFGVGLWLGTKAYGKATKFLTSN
jgi:hypothetical protein